MFVVLTTQDHGADPEGPLNVEVDWTTTYGPFATWADADTFASRIQDRRSWVLELTEPMP